jgi:hypothetical protein
MFALVCFIAYIAIWFFVYRKLEQKDPCAPLSFVSAMLWPFTAILLVCSKYSKMSDK